MASCVELVHYDFVFEQRVWIKAVLNVGHGSPAKSPRMPKVPIQQRAAY
jgi:hypothetical protein